MNFTKKILFATLATVSFGSFADDRFANVEMAVQELGHSVHMMTGSGGNIGVSAGPDGILIVDDQYAPLAEKIAAALQQLGSDKPRYVINTHYHGDHTGSNAFFAGTKNATIFAHENVRVRLASDAETPTKALPVVTYEDGIRFHFNGDTIRVKHLPGGHTDGDSVIWFEQPNVVHTGDLFFNNMFPYIDLGAGGSVEGYIASVVQILDMTDAETKIIPGHGELAYKADLERFLNMIRQTYEFVQVHKAAGKSVEQIIEMGLDEQWQSWSWRFITEERWIKTLYQ